MLAVTEFGFRQSGTIPEPCLVNSSNPLSQPSMFLVRRELFGYQLLYVQFRKNGLRYTMLWHAASITALATMLQEKVEEKSSEGYSIVSMYPVAWQTIENRLLKCKVYNINKEIRSFGYIEVAKSEPLQNNKMLSNLRRTLSSIIRMTEDESEDIKDNLVRLATPIQWPSLNKSLRSVFMRDKKILEIVFRMEDDGIIFLGDFVQLKKDQVEFYTRNPIITKKMIDYLQGRSLCTDMIVKNWPRPSTFGIAM